MLQVDSLLSEPPVKPIIGYYKILSIVHVLYSRSLFVIYFIYSNVCYMYANPNLLIYHTPFRLFSISVGLFMFCM